MKRKVWYLSVLATLVLSAGCAGPIAIVKKDEWNRRDQELTAMRDDLRKLEMKMENMSRDQERQIQILKADMTQLFTDMGRNLNQLSGKVEESKNDLQRLNKTTEKLSERKFVIKSSGKTPGDSSVSDSIIVEDKLDVQKFFQIARRDMNAKDYDRALKEFAEITAKFPADPIVPECLYWTGEVRMIRKEYKEALVQYREIIDRFPESSQAAPALFKIGLCHQKLNDTAAMKKAWTDLIEKFPYSDEALQAKARMIP